MDYSVADQTCPGHTNSLNFCDILQTLITDINDAGGDLGVQTAAELVHEVEDHHRWKLFEKKQNLDRTKILIEYVMSVLEEINFQAETAEDIISSYERSKVVLKTALKDEPVLLHQNLKIALKALQSFVLRAAPSTSVSNVPSDMHTQLVSFWTEIFRTMDYQNPDTSIEHCVRYVFFIVRRWRLSVGVVNKTLEVFFHQTLVTGRP